MTADRVIGWVGGAVLLAAWIAAANSDRPAGPSPASAPVPVEAPSFDGLHDQTERLSDRLRRMPKPVVTARNPFRFANRPRREPVGLAATVTRPAASPVPTTLRLIGLAETRETEGVIRTAVLSGDGRTTLVRVGDVVADFTVRAISSEAIELAGADGSAVILALP